MRSIEPRGARAIAVAADVALEADVLRLFDTCDRTLGPLTALVNNAGILETQMRVDSMEMGRLQRVFGTNVIGALTIGLARDALMPFGQDSYIRTCMRAAASRTVSIALRHSFR